MFCMLNKTCLVLVINIGHSRRLLSFINHLHAMFGRNFPMASTARTVIYNIILIYFNIYIIIVTSFAPISSKIKLSGATKPED